MTSKEESPQRKFKRHLQKKIADAATKEERDFLRAIYPACVEYLDTEKHLALMYAMNIVNTIS